MSHSLGAILRHFPTLFECHFVKATILISTQQPQLFIIALSTLPSYTLGIHITRLSSLRSIFQTLIQWDPKRVRKYHSSSDKFELVWQIKKTYLERFFPTLQRNRSTINRIFESFEKMGVFRLFWFWLWIEESWDNLRFFKINIDFEHLNYDSLHIIVHLLLQIISRSQISIP